MEKTNILITGGAGYLGSVMTRHFLERGKKVTCIDNLMYNQQSPLAFIDNPQYTFHYGDCRDNRIIEGLVRKNDIIIPLAALVGMDICKRFSDDAKTINHKAVAHINKLRSSNQLLIFPTTNSGYGSTNGSIYCTEETPLNPISVYGETKASAELGLLESGKEVVTLRLATVFGLSPRMRLDLLVNDFTFRAFRDKNLKIYEKHFRRNIVHIKDIARVFEHSIDNFDIMKKSKIFNVGLPNVNLSKEEIAFKIKDYIPDLLINECEGKDPDKRNYIVSNQRLLNAGFTFQYSLDYGIQELIKAYQLLSVSHIASSSNNHTYTKK